MEFEFLSRLATDPTRVYTKHELLREVWGERSWRGPARCT